jgi:hypothetical protein
VKYGIDGYSRYVIRDGEKIAVEFHPFGSIFSPIKCLAAFGVFQWHIGMIRQHGFSEWNQLRKY